MTKYISVIIISLTLTACGQETAFDKEIWLETNSMTIYDPSKEELFTGKLTGREDGKEFFGNVKDGKPDGMCYWLNADSDTIQTLKFQNGEKVFSQQFDQDGNRRGKEWSMQFIDTKNSDQELISKFLKLLLEKSIDSIRRFYQPSSSIPELDPLRKKIEEIKEINGEVTDWKISNIEKRKFAHRDEIYIEAQIVLYAEKDDLDYNIRLLTEDGIVTSINFWKRENEVAKNDFVKPDFYFFLKM